MQRIDPITTIALQELGQVVLELRRELGITQRSLAVMSGLSQPTISRVERGLTPGMPLRTFARLVAGITRSVALADDFHRLQLLRPSPYWTVLQGAFGIEGRIHRRLAVRDAQREAERQKRLRTLARKLRA